jgi:hypothetical protein
VVDLVRSLSLQGRSRRNALLALRTMQQQRADLASGAAVYPVEPVHPRQAASGRSADPVLPGR